MKIPTDEELNAAVGNPLQYVDETGKPNIHWEQKHLTLVPLIKPLMACWNKDVIITKVKCNIKIAPFLKAVLDELLIDPEVGPTINDYGGCYEFRMQRKSTKLSRHSWGTAIDLDVADNPFGREPKTHPRTIEIFANNGFMWGGNFKGTRKDGMHFEFADLGRIKIIDS